MRERRAKGSVPPDVTHGTYSTYANYLCRCEACTEANREYHREYYHRSKGWERPDA